MKDAGVTTEQLDWLVLHQANQRILDAAAQRLSIPSDRVVSNLEEYGNTSAASIPLAFDEAVRGGKIKSGDMVSVFSCYAFDTYAPATIDTCAPGTDTSVTRACTRCAEQLMAGVPNGCACCLPDGYSSYGQAV